eukprot:4828933-Heterocapsa_arctica.AAC.1
MCGNWHAIQTHRGNVVEIPFGARACQSIRLTLTRSLELTAVNKCAYVHRKNSVLAIRKLT